MANEPHSVEVEVEVVLPVGNTYQREWISLSAAPVRGDSLRVRTRTYVVCDVLHDYQKVTVGGTGSGYMTMKHSVKVLVAVADPKQWWGA